MTGPPTISTLGVALYQVELQKKLKCHMDVSVLIEEGENARFIRAIFERIIETSQQLHVPIEEQLFSERGRKSAD